MALNNLVLREPLKDRLNATNVGCCFLLLRMIILDIMVANMTQIILEYTFIIQNSNQPVLCGLGAARKKFKKRSKIV